QQRHCLGGSAVVGQRCQADLVSGQTDAVAVDAIGETKAGTAADEVVETGDSRAVDIGRAVRAGVSSDYAVNQSDRRIGRGAKTRVSEAAAAETSGIAGQGAATNRQRPEIVDAPA